MISCGVLRYYNELIPIDFLYDRFYYSILIDIEMF